MSYRLARISLCSDIQRKGASSPRKSEAERIPSLLTLDSHLRWTEPKQRTRVKITKALILRLTPRRSLIENNVPKPFQHHPRVKTRPYRPRATIPDSHHISPSAGAAPLPQSRRSAHSMSRRDLQVSERRTKRSSSRIWLCRLGAPRVYSLRRCRR